MALLRIYSKQGALLQAITCPAAIVQGQIDYLGAGQFLVARSAAIEQFACNGVAAEFVRTLYTYAGPSGKGVVVPRRMLGEPGTDLDGQDSDHFIATELSGTTLSAVSRDLGGGVALVSSTLLTAHLTEGAIATDGHHYYVSRTSTSFPASVQIKLFARNGATWTDLISWNVATAPADMTHDGAYLWTIEGTTVKQYAPNGAALTLVNSFAASGGTILGLCTDGHNLFALSRT